MRINLVLSGLSFNFSVNMKYYFITSTSYLHCVYLVQPCNPKFTFTWRSEIGHMQLVIVIIDGFIELKIDTDPLMCLRPRRASPGTDMGEYPKKKRQPVALPIPLGRLVRNRNTLCTS